MYSSVDTIWVLLGGVLVFFMQAGFAMVETGFTRAKNAGNIIMKNLMDFAIGTLVFWAIGFGLMFAGDGKLVGGLDFLIQGDYSSSIPTAAFIIFQTVFCATAATIVSGAMAERTKFVSYCIYSAVISAVIYPISGHWIWGGGWLAQLGFHDFAGSTAVHMVGGVAALIGAKMLGPRIGKYGKDGKPRAIPGHSLTLGALGVFILWFCWFGFNGCSTVSMTGDSAIVSASSIFVTTNIAAATAATAVMLITWFRYKKPDVSMTLNGALAGLVAITAGCDAVSPVGSFFIGLIAAFVVVFGIEFVDKVLKIDDPVGAIGVHGMCGAVGTILTGFFALDGGVFYGGGFKFLGIQTLGVVSVIAWVAVTITVVFWIIKKTIGLRVSKEEEIAGLDIKEHGLVSSYADFMPATVEGG
ncbi:MAG: ammonium transporter, partial [Eubacteriales bacterium]|nr:ammonium transporter [Eubacteriales bacterium]